MSRRKKDMIGSETTPAIQGPPVAVNGTGTVYMLDDEPPRSAIMLRDPLAELLDAAQRATAMQALAETYAKRGLPVPPAVYRVRDEAMRQAEHLASEVSSS